LQQITYSRLKAIEEEKEMIDVEVVRNQRNDYLSDRAKEQKKLRDEVVHASSKFPRNGAEWK
jgi:hypothetical protein